MLWKPWILPGFTSSKFTYIHRKYNYFTEILMTPFKRNHMHGYRRSNEPNCSMKKSFLKISQNVQENSWAGVPDLQIYKKKTPTRDFCSEFCEMIKNILFRRTPWGGCSSCTIYLWYSWNLGLFFKFTIHNNTLRENCSNTELFLVRIQKNTAQK